MRLSKSISIIFIYIFAMFLLPFISSTLLVNFTSISEEATLIVFVNLISYVFLTVVCLILFGSHLVEDFKNITSVGSYLKGVLSGWAFLLVTLMASSLLLLLIKGEADTSQNQQVIVNTMESYPFIMAITTVLFAPLVEEVIFRLTLMKKVIFHPWVGILFSSLLFGLIHVISARDFIFIIPYMAMGIPLGYSYYKTKNICYPIGIHLLQNLFATLTITVPIILY